MIERFSEDIDISIDKKYFDFYKLLKSDIKSSATMSSKLLENVAKHKTIYFRAGWAKYDNARKGTLRLIPQQAVLKELEGDYRKMKEMFYGIEVDWLEIVHTIEKFELEFNSLSL